jgi:UDP-glucose 4-epimerase
MIQRALRQEPIRVFGDGQQSRCFSAVSDVVRGVMLLADHKGAEGEIYNIGTDEEVTVLELAQRIKALCQSDSTIELVAYEDIYGPSFEDMRRRVPNLAKIRQAVGYEPQVTLDQLLEVTILAMREQSAKRQPAGLATA